MYSIIRCYSFSHFSRTALFKDISIAYKYSIRSKGGPYILCADRRYVWITFTMIARNRVFPIKSLVATDPNLGPIPPKQMFYFALERLHMWLWRWYIHVNYSCWLTDFDSVLLRHGFGNRGEHMIWRYNRHSLYQHICKMVYAINCVLACFDVSDQRTFNMLLQISQSMKELSIANVMPLNLKTGANVSCMFARTYIVCYYPLLQDRPCHLQLLRDDFGVHLHIIAFNNMSTY